MPGLAAIVNNAVPDGKSIQCFYNTNNLNLGLVLENGAADGADSEKSFAANSTDQKGIIVNPSRVGAIGYLGINLIVGITQPVLPANVTTYTKYDVSIISPIYKQLTQTEANNTSIAACSYKDKAWVYYLGGPDQASTELKEYLLENVKVTEHSGTNRILFKSSLAAYYNTEKKQRCVIYQEEKSFHLYEYSIEDENSTHLSNSTDAVKGTTIAVTYAGKQAYCYYTDSSKEIRKIVKSDGKWGSSLALDDADKVDPDSQLSVATSNGVNHLIYVAEGDDQGQITHYRDPI